MKTNTNTPGSAGGPGGRDRTLAVKSRKNVRKITFFSLKNKIYPPKIFFFCIYLLVMPKYWVKNYFAHGRFPEVGQKQKTEKERERLNNGDKNGQATHGARTAHASRLGQKLYITFFHDFRSACRSRERTCDNQKDHA